VPHTNHFRRILDNGGVDADGLLPVGDGYVYGGGATRGVLEADLVVAAMVWGSTIHVVLGS